MFAIVQREKKRFMSQIISDKRCRFSEPKYFVAFAQDAVFWGGKKSDENGFKINCNIPFHH